MKQYGIHAIMVHIGMLFDQLIFRLLYTKLKLKHHKLHINAQIRPLCSILHYEYSGTYTVVNTLPCYNLQSMFLTQRLNVPIISFQTVQCASTC